MPLFFLSGALFPLQGIPEILDTIIRFNPLTYGVDGVRYAFGGVAHFSIFLDLGIIAGIALFILALGTYLFHKIEI